MPKTPRKIASTINPECARSISVMFVVIHSARHPRSVSQTFAGGRALFLPEFLYSSAFFFCDPYKTYFTVTRET